MFVTYLNQSLQLENGQGGAMVLPSNSSDRSDRSDKPMDQKVLVLSPMSSVLFSVCYHFTMMVSIQFIWYSVGFTTACSKS